MPIRMLHFFWDGPPMPLPLRENLATWHDLHRDWELIVWDSASLRWLAHRDLYDAAPTIVRQDAIWQFRSDIARYEILARYGGFYADCDTYPLQSISPFVEGHDAFAAAEDPNWVGNTYLYADRAHLPVFIALVDRLRASVNDRHKPRRPNHLTGPRYLTPIWHEFGAYVAPTHSWFPYSYTDVRRRVIPDVDPRTAVAVHQWHHHRTVLRVGYP